MQRSLVFPLYHSRARSAHGTGPHVLRTIMAICIALFLCNLCKAESASDSPLERRVKAAFLYRFTEFVTWPEITPASAPPSFVIGIVGSDAMTEELRQIVTGRLVKGRPIELRRLSAGDSLDGCRLVFIGSGERRHLAEIIGAAPFGALVITESDDALKYGSMINFVIADGRVRFEIAVDNAERQGVRLSSRLLSVALAVRTGSP